MVDLPHSKESIKKGSITTISPTRALLHHSKASSKDNSPTAISPTRALLSNSKGFYQAS